MDTNSEDVKLKNLECGVENIQSSLTIGLSVVFQLTINNINYL